MDLQLLFNEETKKYDTYRPNYPSELYEQINDFSGIHAGSELLEIGIGTGQATLPFLEHGCKVTAVELGERLSAFTRKKYRDYKNLDVIQTDFMDYSAKSEVDLVYSATAFHWLPKEAAYQKVYTMLKPGGCVALFWNHPFPNRQSDKSNVASAGVYNKYRPTGKTPKEFDEADCVVRTAELIAHGFKDVKSMLFHRQRVLRTDAYIGLLNTYSDHLSLDPVIKTAFERDMKAAIDAVGGEITIYDTIDLYLGRK